MAQTKEEKAAYMKAYYLANKEKMDAASKAWRLVNPEKCSAHKKSWKKTNPEKVAVQVKAWRQANPEKVAVHSKAWQQANPEKRAAIKKTYYLKLNLMNKKITRRTLNAWALQVKERDCYTCRDCGATDNLHAHHIWPKISHPEHALDVVNGTTLCEECHIYEHGLN